MPIAERSRFVDAKPEASPVASLDDQEIVPEALVLVKGQAHEFRVLGLESLRR